MSSKQGAVPAILGGSPKVTSALKDAHRWPVLTAEDERAVLEVLRDGNISTSPIIRKMEADYVAFSGRKYALAHCNGSSALLAAFFALGLEPGDEILVPTSTWWASVLPMMWVGLVPVFCEGESQRLGIDPDDMEKRITSRTRAVVVVHLWGMPAHMTRIREVAAKHKLKIIEDASHAHGATWRGVKCGALGDISVFSMQGDKLAPAGEGGVLLTDDATYHERATCLGDVTRVIELETPARRFAATTFGIKTRIAPVSAAIARVQLRALPENNRRRNENIEYLSEKLESYGCYDTFRPPAHIARTYFEFIVRYNEARGGLPQDLLVRALQAEGCFVSAPRYPLLHQQPFFTEGAWKNVLRVPERESTLRYLPNALPRTEADGASLLRLPAFSTATREVLDQYARAFDAVHANKAAILEHARTAKPAGSEVR